MADTKDLEKAAKLLSTYTSIKKEVVDCGILGLNILWNGGLSLGGCYGLGSQQGAGKSTICLTICRHLIETYNYTTVYIDVEQGISDKQLESLGLLKYKGNKLLLIQNAITFDDLQEVCDSCITLAETQNIKLIVVDSLNQISTKSLTQQNLEDRKVAPYAKPMSEWIRNFKGRFGVAGIASILLGQAGANIGAGMWDPQWYVKLPYAVQHGVDIMTYIEHSPFKKDQIYQTINTPNGPAEVSIGYWGKIWTAKTRGALQKLKIRLPILMGPGIDNVLFLRECLINTGEISKRGETYKLVFKKDEKTFVGQDELDLFISSNYQYFVDYLKDKKYFDLRNDVALKSDAVKSVSTSSKADKPKEKKRISIMDL